jgi:glutamyl-tRNA reductase
VLDSTAGLLAVGLSYRTAPLEVREQAAIPADALPGLLRDLVATGVVAEAVVVSTCNRVEGYFVAEGATDTAIAAIRERLRIPEASSYQHEGERAINHIFRVASSLDSLVLGEAQILGQVKEAFAVAREAGTVGPVLDQCMARAFKVAKRVRTETPIAKSVVSVGHVAVELARTIFGSLGGVSVLLVGAGKMGLLAARHLATHGAEKVLVTNRTFERGRLLAERHGWSASAYDDLPLLLQAVDVVICSTGAPRPIIVRDMVEKAMKKRRFRPLFLIDIAVPRDIEAAVGEVDDVYVYNIDDLEQVSRSNAAGRADAAKAAEAIVKHEVSAFERWRRERVAAPVIRQIREHALAVAAAEADKALRHLNGLDSKGQETVKKLAEVIASRLSRAPIEALKNSAGSRHGDSLAAAAATLFELPEE